MPYPESKYFVLYVNTFHYVNRNATRINSRITDFNMNNFLIPSHNQTRLCRFTVKSAIVRLGETVNNGHYITWTRSYNDNRWLKISDSQISNYNKYSNSQNNVQFYFLQRI